jgi:glycosyltransferase involved in cell wall biosynthesis
MALTMKIYLYIFCFISLVFGASAEEAKKKTICLNMIVKNESKVITRCLASLKPIIDYWVILDTGSTDDTKKIIQDFMKDKPGELHEDAFVNFEYSRNKALDFAKNKGDYVLFIDADEVLDIPKDFNMPQLDKDFYHIITDFNGMDYARVQLIKNDLNWRWVGVLHEAVTCPQAITSAIIPAVRNVVRTDGARSTDPQKFQKDAKLLENALKEEPTNTRYTFYLAQSYRDAGDFEKSIEWYQKRIDMGGWDQEIFWSMLQIARMRQALNQPPETFLPGYYKAFNYRSTRAEPIYQLANYYRLKEDYASGYLMASIGSRIPVSKDLLFVERWMYDYGIPLEQSICAYWIGKYDECRDISLKILSQPKLPNHIRECVERNLSLANKKLAEIYFENVMTVKEKAAA